ncbi:hypothetical protein P409_28375, partial [Inquilinus limosus MP06]
MLMSRDREFWPEGAAARFERLLLGRVEVDSLVKAASASLSTDWDWLCDDDRVGVAAACCDAGGGGVGRLPGFGAAVGAIAIGSASAVWA